MVVDEDRGRPIALTLNPIGLPLGRLSANAELLLGPHHALIASPDVLLFQVERGGHNLISEGFGFATRTSSSFGLELGYHYWPQARRSLTGIFLGPSLLFGATTDAGVGDPTHLQGYWGLAFDAGLQAVFPSGFTIGGGVGLAFLRMADATAVLPRLLLQVGWSF